MGWIQDISRTGPQPIIWHGSSGGNFSQLGNSGNPAISIKGKGLANVKMYVESMGGSRNSRRRGRQPMTLPKFSKKLHEIEKNFGCGGGAPGAPP